MEISFTSLDGRTHQGMVERVLGPSYYMVRVGPNPYTVLWHKESQSFREVSISG